MSTIEKIYAWAKEKIELSTDPIEWYQVAEFFKLYPDKSDKIRADNTRKKINRYAKKNGLIQIQTKKGKERMKSKKKMENLNQ